MIVRRTAEGTAPGAHQGSVGSRALVNWRGSRLLWAVACAVVIGISLSQIILTVATIPFQPPDTEAYWQAALRLRNGEPLYVASEELLARDIYRYAPWFAYVWIPLTYLPKDVVEVGWKLLMVAATVIALVPLLMIRTIGAIAAAALIGWLTVTTALYGNVHPLLIAGMVWTVDRRTGPIWIAVAASLKFVPILYVIVYLGRRDWRRAATTVVLSGALIAPMLGFDLSGYMTVPGESASLYSVHPVLWAAVAAVAIGLSAVMAVRRSPHSWLAASVAVYLAYPQTFLSYTSHFLVGTRRPDSGDGAR
jgi:hypothetical protein